MIMQKSYATNNIKRVSSSIPNCPNALVSLICDSDCTESTLAPPLMTVNPLGVTLPA
jgi:hypothetical protein